MGSFKLSKTMGRINILIITFIIATSTSFSQAKKNSVSSNIDEVLIRQLLENYKISINKTDTTLAKSIWLTSPEVSFIHPRGHEKGWTNIKKGIYGMFDARFSQRDLKSYDETVTIYGDMAVLEFYWIFDAVYKGENPSKMQSKGRETQVLKKMDNNWRIVLVHYSGMPKTGEREGF